MIFRNIFRAILKDENTEDFKKEVKGLNIKSNSILTFSLFKDGKDLFAYYECKGINIEISKILKAVVIFLEPYPSKEGPRYFIPMMDIFHYNKPIEDNNWRLSDHKGKPWPRITRIKPEMLSSYIFYHHQYQEEKPGDGDKYGIIALNENLLFFYMEVPELKEKAKYEGLLKTKNSPYNIWSEVMMPHFMPWEGVAKGQEIWKEVELIIHM